MAKQESDMILGEAKSNANRIVSDALLRAEKVEYDAARLRKNISLFKRSLRDKLQEQLNMVDDIEILDIENM
jgi:cell division septum initiation protein DivIVA